MSAFARILCPSDFSPFSRFAFDMATSVGSPSQGTVRALHVVAPVRALPGRTSMAQSPMLLAPQDRETLLEELERFVEPARASGLRIEVSLGEGDVVGTIVDEAKRWPADLVVMGTRGRCPRNGWAVGSVTEGVLKRCPCPVLVVPRATARDSAGSPHNLRRILCPLDFSQPGREALRYAAALARESGAQLTFLHTLEWFPEEGVRLDMPLYVPEYRLDLAQEARQRMRALIAQENLVGCEHEELVATGRPPRAVLRACRERKADLIVLGIHGRRAIDQVLSGATVSHVVREARCPTLVVRPQ